MYYSRKFIYADRVSFPPKKKNNSFVSLSFVPNQSTRFLILFRLSLFSSYSVPFLDYLSHAPSIVRWVSVLFGGSSSLVPWLHTIGQTVLIGIVFSIGIAFQIPQLQLSTRACGKSILQAIRTDTDIFLSAEEFATITNLQSQNLPMGTLDEELKRYQIDQELYEMVDSSRHATPPRCIRADGFSLLFVALVTTIYATLRWHAVGLSSVLSIPEKWGMDTTSGLWYWEESKLPRNDLTGRLFQTLRITVREGIIMSFRPIFIVLFFQMIGLLPSSLLIYLDYFLRRLTILGHDDMARAVMLDDQEANDLLSSLPQTISAIHMSIFIAVLHGVHGTLLPLFFSERFSLNDFLSGIVGSPLQFSTSQQTVTNHGSNIQNNLQDAHTPPTKFDMILSAMRVVYPRSVQHYMLSYPAHTRAETIAAAGGTNVSEIGPNVTYVFPPWARREVVRTQTSSSGKLSTTVVTTTDESTTVDDKPSTEDHRRGLATSVKLVTWKPGTVVLPTLGISTARFKLDEASFIRAWQERLECGNWALWGDKEVYGQYGSSKGSYGNRGYGRPLFLLSSMLRITSPGRALAENLWFNYPIEKEEPNLSTGNNSSDISRNVALATTSPWLHILRDLCLCGGDVPLASTNLERFGLVQTLQQLTIDLSKENSTLESRMQDEFRTYIFSSKDDRQRIMDKSVPILSDFVLDRNGKYGKSIPPSETKVGKRRGDKKDHHTTGNAGELTLEDLSTDFNTSSSTTNDRVFIQSLGPQTTDANDRIAIFNDGLYRKWRDFLWTSTGIIDSTTIHLLTAAASDVLPVAANSTVAIATEIPPLAIDPKVSRLGPLVPPVTPLAPRKRAGTDNEPTVGKTVVAKDTKTQTNSSSVDETGAMVRIIRTVYNVGLRLYGIMTKIYGKIQPYVYPYIWVPFITYMVPLFVTLGQYTGITYLYELFRYIASIILFQIRPYEAVVSAKSWFKTKAANTNLNVRKHKLPLSLDEIIGGSTLDARDAPRLTKVLISMVAPKVDVNELATLSTSAVLQLQSSTMPKIFQKSRTVAGSILDGQGSKVAAQSSTTSTTHTFSKSSLSVHRLQESSIALPDSRIKRSFLFFTKRSFHVCFRQRYILRIGWNVIQDCMYAFGWKHIQNIYHLLYESIKIAAGVSDTTVSSLSTSSIPHESSVDRSTTESFKLIRDTVRSSLTRNPAQDTADLLRDLRAITAVIDLLVSVVIGALRGEDRNLRQVAPTVPVVVYSIASCLAAAATYLSSPRYSATTVWTDPLYYRGTDAESIAIAQVEAALGNTLRGMESSITAHNSVYSLSSHRGSTHGSIGYGVSGTPNTVIGPPVTPSMQVNIHPTKGLPYTEHVPCSARPTVAALISVLLHNLVILFSQEATIPGMDVYMDALTFNAPSLAIKAVLMIASRRAKADQEERMTQKKGSINNEGISKKDDDGELSKKEEDALRTDKDDGNNNDI